MNHYSDLAITRSSKLDVATQLRDYSAGTITAAASETAIAVLRWHRHYNYKCVIDNHPYTNYTQGTNEWTIAVEAAGQGGGSFTELGSVTIPGSLATSEIALSGALILSKLNISEIKSQPVIRVTATPTGSPGELNYSAYLTCI